MSQRLNSISFAAAILIALSCSLSPISSKAATLTFGIVPQESSSKLAQQWTPMMRYLSDYLGKPVRFATAPDIPTFEQRVASGQYDIAYMNPYHYAEFAKQPGYRVIVRERGKKITGIVVVQQSSNIESLLDLNDQTIAFPAPAAFAATILVRAELERLGIVYQPKFVSSHESVYLNVERGFAAAGGGIVRTLDSAEKQGLRGLRILWKSHGFTPHAFAVHPDLSQEDMASFQNALLSIADTTDGLAILETLNLRPMTTARDSDWNDVRALGLNFLEPRGTP